jgi:hypothetical protein
LDQSRLKGLTLALAGNVILETACLDALLLLLSQLRQPVGGGS